MLIKKGLWEVMDGSDPCPAGLSNTKAIKAFECCQAEAHIEIDLHLVLGLLQLAVQGEVSVYL